MSKKNIKVKQFDTTDCGAACLTSICAHYGLQFPLTRIRQYAFTNQKGTNIIGLIEAANKLGFSAKGIRTRLDSLHYAPKPFIAHTTKEEKYHHFITVYKVDSKKEYLVYMDPADGEIHKVNYKNFTKIWTGILVIMEPEKSFKKGNLKTSMTQKFLSLLLPHKKIILQTIVGALIYSILGLSTSLYIGKITDYILINKNINLLNLMGVFMFIIILLRSFIGSMKNILILKIGQQIDAVLILGYYRHLLKLPKTFFDTMKTGEIISRINDAIKIRNFINNVSLDLMVNILIIIFSFILMFAYSWKLALIICLSLPIFSFILKVFNKFNKIYQRKIMESNANLESQLIESVNSISTIKQFGIEEHANLKTELYFVQVLKNSYHSIYGYILTKNSIQFISTSIIIIVLWIGSSLVINQELTSGELMIFYSLIGYIITPIGTLITSNQTIQDALIAADRLFQIMDLEQEDDNSPKIILEKEMINDIVFDNVTFRYDSHKDIFIDLNLKIKKGITTAIVGENGSGKTTLASLIQHIYDIQKGIIRIGNYNITQINNQSLHRWISSVPQHIELFSGTVIENIALGEINPNIKRINDLIEQLGLKDLIEKLPKGLMTYINEQGTSLSGGERQRIAIARALYKEPEILIFDEATSSLDTISENYIKRTLKDLATKRKTIIIIAHKLTTIKDADQIIVLEKGKVVEIGKHQELYKSGGIYNQLWNDN